MSSRRECDQPLVNAVMRTFGWTEPWEPSPGQRVLFVGVWTGPETDQLCVKRCHNAEDADDWLSPEAKTVWGAVAKSITKRLVGEVYEALGRRVPALWTRSGKPPFKERKRAIQMHRAYQEGLRARHDGVGSNPYNPRKDCWDAWQRGREGYYELDHIMQLTTRLGNMQDIHEANRTTSGQLGVGDCRTLLGALVSGMLNMAEGEDIKKALAWWASHPEAVDALVYLRLQLERDALEEDGSGR